MPAVQEKQPDQQRIVASLAKECQMPIGEMAALYEHERAELASGARITKFLHIFATRKVLEVLHQRDLDKEGSVAGTPNLLTAGPGHDGDGLVGAGARHLGGRRQRPTGHPGG